MKTNRSMVLWKKSALFLFYIVVAFFTIIGWQLTEVHAQKSPTCPDPPVRFKIPDEISVVEIGDRQEKTLEDKTDENWFQYYYATSEEHSINMEDPPETALEDLTWQVYDRGGNCVAAGNSGQSFGPSSGGLELDADIYFIRVIWDPVDPKSEFPDEDIIYSFLVQGTSIPSVYGEIKGAFSGEKLANVTVNSTLSQVLSFLSGFYMLHIPNGRDDLEYSLDGYEREQIGAFDTSVDDYFPQDVILCPNDVVLTATPTAPLTVTFDLPDVTNPEVSADYDWDFGDGKSSDRSEPVSHTYLDTGTYNVNVSVSVTLSDDSPFVTKQVECSVTSSVDVSVGEDTDTDTIFADVPPGYWAEDFIEKIFNAGITSGCSQNPRRYCPEDPVTRAQMAVFLERGININDSDYDPPGATGIFDDVPVSHGAADWVEQFYVDEITNGCSKAPLLYCPDALVTRAQMAVFLLKSKHKEEEDYTPPSAVGIVGIFDDVPVSHWAVKWIEALYNEGISGGCNTNPLMYCPDSHVTRAEMAVFIFRAFEL